MDFLTSAEIGKWLSHRLPACKHLFIASPFVTAGPLEPIRRQLKKREDFRFTLVTNVNVMAALMGALDLDALSKLLRAKDHRGHVELLHDPQLHAKVMMVDQRCALVGSANLTRAGIGGRNVELATEITGEQQLRDLWHVIEPWTTTRPRVTRDSLEAVSERAAQLAAGLKGHMRAIRTATSTNLPRIVGRGEAVAYFQNLRDFLIWVRAGSTGARTVKGAKGWLLNTGKQDQSSRAPESDLHFIAALGLVRFKGSKVRKIECTRDGGRVLAKSGRKFVFDLLWPRYPEFRWAGRFFTGLRTTSVTWKELRSRAPDWVDAPDVPTNWLRSLKLVHPHKRSHKGPTKMRLSLDRRRTWIQHALEDRTDQDAP